LGGVAGATAARPTKQRRGRVGTGPSTNFRNANSGRRQVSSMEIRNPATERKPAVAPYGPFAKGPDPIERARKLMCFAGITACHLGSGHPLVSELRLAETDDAALEHAFEMFEELPALPKRRVIATYAAVMQPQRRAR
jgi:hypothetical protein